MTCKNILLSLSLLLPLFSVSQSGFKIHNGGNFAVHDNAEVGIFVNSTVGGNFRTRNTLIRFYGQSWTNESTALFQDESSSGNGFTGTGGQFYFMQPNPLTGTSTAQTINGGLSNVFTLNGLSFPNLTIDNPNNVSLTGNQLRVRNDFQFLSGKLITTSQSIGIGGTIDGFTNSRYFVTGNSGSLVRYNVANSTVNFPVGYDASTYNPITIIESGTADHFAVTALQHLLLQGATGSPASINAVDASWRITDAVAGGNNLTLSPSWFASDELPGFNRAASAVSMYTTRWDVIASSAATGGPMFSQLRPNITGTGYFSVQAPGMPLPLTLIDFRGSFQNRNTLLEWRTANEINIDKYIVQHSSNGRDFSTIGTVAARNTQSNYYSLVHPNRTDGIHYYRLEILELDGAKQFSRIITIYLNNMNQVLVYPTITHNTVNVQLPQNGSYQKAKATLLGVNGQTVSIFNLQKGHNHLQFGNLAAGQYSLRIETDKETVVKQIIIAR